MKKIEIKSKEGFVRGTTAQVKPLNEKPFFRVIVCGYSDNMYLGALWNVKEDTEDKLIKTLRQIARQRSARLYIKTE